MRSENSIDIRAAASPNRRVSNTYFASYYKDMKIYSKITILILTIFITVIVGYRVLHNNSTSENSGGTIVGGVVPHHLLVERKMEEFWQQAVGRVQPEIIILVGPDHENRGQSHVTTTLDAAALRTHFALDTTVLEQLIQSGAVSSDPGALSQEHSVYLHVPYIERLFPQAQLVPLMVRSDTSQKEILNLAETLRAKLVDKRVLIVASVDFSHYLSATKAEKMDTDSLAALQAFDYDRLATFESEHMDSDQAITLVSELVCPTHDCTWEQWWHGNSAEVPGQNNQVTTSYFLLWLAEKKEKN